MGSLNYVQTMVAACSGQFFYQLINPSVNIYHLLILLTDLTGTSKIIPPSAVTRIMPGMVAMARCTRAVRAFNSFWPNQAGDEWAMASSTSLQPAMQCHVLGSFKALKAQNLVATILSSSFIRFFELFSFHVILVGFLRNVWIILKIRYTIV